MNPYVSRARRILLTAAAALILTGCSGLGSLFGPSDHEGSGDSLFGSSDQPTTINQGTIDQGSFTLSPDEVQVGVFSTTASGDLFVTVDWDNAQSSIGLGLYPGTCTVGDILEDRLTGACSDAALVAEVDPILVVKPKVLIAPNLAPGTYTLAIEYDSEPGQATLTGTYTIIQSPLSQAAQD